MYSTIVAGAKDRKLIIILSYLILSYLVAHCKDQDPAILATGGSAGDAQMEILIPLDKI